MQGSRAWLLLALVTAVPQAAAQGGAAIDEAATLDTVEVLADRRPLSSFPGAITVLPGEVLREGQRQVNLSESLQRVPGITVLDRGNYAQDLQVQSRGFGARSTFGIRGIRLVADGIPSSATDGQGQAANFPLGMLDRIEVLRGPLALQYGNAAGGAIVAHTDLETRSEGTLQAWTGSDDSWRAGATLGGFSADVSRRWRVHASHFRTGGARPHSAAERSQVHAVGEWSPYRGNRLRWVASSLVQPWTEDPLGLGRALWESDPHGTDPAASRFNTRKRVGNHQAGVRWEHAFPGGREVWIGGYGIDRDIVQYLSIPPVAQAAPTSSGGVIDVDRQSWGAEAGHRWRFARGALAVGVEGGRLDEDRRGYENFDGGRLGVRGRLRRDEANRVHSADLFAIVDLRPAEHWTLLMAARRSTLAFASRDHYIAPGNGDDSGRFDFNETSAALGIARAFGAGGAGRGEAFASIGHGFESPTVTELAYRPDGQGGFNRDLEAARLRSAEAGLRWRFGSASTSMALYRIDGTGEIVPAISSGGRTSFANAGRTRRDGLELGLEGAIGPRWRYALAANLINARFVDGYGFRSGAQGELRVVEAGNRIPGIPRADGFAEVAWHGAGDRLQLAVEARLSAAVATDDRNSDAAPGYARVALRGGWQPASTRAWRVFARIDNLFDRDHVGSVIVNDGNGRYFEPGAPRSFTLGVTHEFGR